jgi:5'-3' exonuclease
MVIVPKQMSKTKKLFVPAHFVPELADDEEDEFFSLNDAHISGSGIDKIVKTLKSKDYVEHIVDPTDEVLSKILLGDKSDNIPKITGVSPSKSKKIISNLRNKFGDSILEKLDQLDSAFISIFLDELKAVNKIKDLDKIEEIRTHLIFNIKIIRLSVNLFPDEIREALESFFTSHETLRFNSREFINLKNNLSSL